MASPKTRILALEVQLAKAQANMVKSKPQDLTSDCFPEQKRFVECQDRLQVLIATRRSGKSYALGLKLFLTALLKPRSTSLYIGLTRDSASRIMVKDVLEVIDSKYKLGSTFTKVPLAVTLPNGSIIYLLGMDSSDKERAKALGQKLALAVVDEAASFQTDLHELVYKTLKPATADLQGSIILSSTPANVKRGLFFELTNDQDPCTPGLWPASATLRIGERDIRYGGWSGHRFSAFQNPNVKWQKEIEDLIASSPGIQDTPGFIQEYFGRWYIDQSKLVYRYLTGRNDYETLPIYVKGSWHAILGCDIGFNDPTSVTLVKWHDFDPTLYVVRNFAKSGLDVTASAEVIQSFLDEYPEIEAVIIDGANKQAVKEIQDRHDIALTPADKQGKMDFIAIMNSDFIRSRIKLHSSCDELKQELQELVLNERSLVPQENPQCRNDRCDSLLYAWRHAYSYLAEAPPPKETDPVKLAIQREEERDAEIEENFRLKKEEEEWSRPDWSETQID